MAFQPLCRGGTIAMQRIVYTHGRIWSSSSSAASYMSTNIPPITRRDEDVAMKNNIQQKVRKRLDVALVGAPNAGKSQLLNTLIGSKVAAVSRKRHTTRMGILGARTFEDEKESTQVVFIDTPGFLHHKMGVKEGIRKLLGEASAEMESADFTLLVVDAAKKLEEDMKRTLITLIFLALRSKGRNENAVRNKQTDTIYTPDKAASEQLNKFAVVINKCDLVNPKEKLLAVAADVGSVAESCIRRLLQQHRSPSKVRLGDLVDSVYENHTEEEGFDGVHEDDIETFAAVVPEFMFTAAIDKDDEGVEDVLGLLLDRATPSKEWIVDPESITGLSPVEQVEEIIREKVYRCLHREVPHAVQQQNRMFRLIEPDEGKSDIGKGSLLRIHQDLVVRTKSHQRLVLGSGGKTLERIRSTAHKDLEEAFACEVDLNLNVRISKSNNTEVPLEADGGASSNFPI
jgi:GTPase